MDNPVRLELVGDFQQDIKGTKIRFRGSPDDVDVKRDKAYMKNFALKQTGEVGDITAGDITKSNGLRLSLR